MPFSGGTQPKEQTVSKDVKCLDVSCREENQSCQTELIQNDKDLTRQIKSTVNGVLIRDPLPLKDVEKGDKIDKE